MAKLTFYITDTALDQLNTSKRGLCNQPVIQLVEASYKVEVERADQPGVEVVKDRHACTNH